MRSETRSQSAGLSGPKLALTAILLALAFCVLLGMWSRAPFQYDEAVYAIKARQWIDATPATQWRIFRPPGMSILGYVVLSIQNSDFALRLLGLAGALGAAGALYALAQRVVGGWPALIATASFAAAPTVQLRGGQFMNDLPATALLLLMCICIQDTFERRGRGSRLVLAAFFAAGAFYLRYASVFPIFAVAGTSAALWRAHLKSHLRLLVTPAITMTVLLVPHFVYSTSQTGTPWGITQLASEVPLQWRQSIGEGLWQYMRWFPSRLAGHVAGILMLAATVALLKSLRRAAGSGGALNPERRAVLFLAIPAFLQILYLGLTHHAEERFLFFPVALLVIAGAGFLAGTFQRMRLAQTRGRRLLVTGSCVLAIAAGGVPTLRNSQNLAESRMPLATAAKEIRKHADRPCSAVSVDGPVVAWYSGCATYRYDQRPPKSRSRFLIVLPGHRFQPTGATLERHLAEASPEPIFHLRRRDSDDSSVLVYLLPSDSPSSPERI
ncbi:MAG TPA: glycosyltransferase family 39 protein [Actinomycetota bacterium]|nr:glycosyltransferase family 39 protein [Actinomycetota bacterium]